MHYDDYAQAIKYLKLALPEMNRHGVPVTPSNYSVWYEYSTGKHAELIEAISLLKEQGEPFSQSVNDLLHEKFIGSGNESSLNRLNSSVKSIIHDLIQKIQFEHSELDHYTSSLKKVSKEVENIRDLEGVETLIERLINETHTRAEETESFKRQVDLMSEEVKNLDRQLKRISIDANTDELTGIMNRRAFNEKVRETQKKCTDSSKIFSLVMIDIDHFKRLNDTFGHLTGDKVLKFIASLIQKNIRGGDYVARFGGEEFVIILPNTVQESALCVADNIRAYLSRQKLYDQKANLQLGVLTLSMGVATYVPSSDTLETMLDRADRCLYHAKSNGRNQTVGEAQLELKSMSVLL